jgi:hypothetical protein
MAPNVREGAPGEGALSGNRVHRLPSDGSRYNPRHRDAQAHRSAAEIAADLRFRARVRALFRRGPRALSELTAQLAADSGRAVP